MELRIGRSCYFSAGNSGVVEWPARMTEALAVGATDPNDYPGFYYDTFIDSLDLMAPGYNVVSFDFSDSLGLNPAVFQCPDNMDYVCNNYGTSFAAPLVAGIAARMLGARYDLIFPKGTENAELIYEILRNTATDLGPEGYDSQFAWGRLNAYRAMVAISRGDVNKDLKINVSDAYYIINYIFAGGPPPTPYFYLGDANCDGHVNVSDAVYIINFSMTGGEPPQICYLNLPE